MLGIRLRSWALVTVALLLAACGGERPTLMAIGPQSARVSETFVLSLPVSNPSGRELRYSVEPLTQACPTAKMPDKRCTVAGWATSTSITGSTNSGEFRWTPLVNHVGQHSIKFVISSPSGEVYDAREAVITVQTSEDSAPVFVRPATGGTFELRRDPCVRVEVEIRDPDSLEVEIRARSPLPRDAVLTTTGPKSAKIEWCPSNDQIAERQRWVFALEADDSDHPPVPHDFLAVLRQDGTGCGLGAPPTIRVLSPADEQRVESANGYAVRATVVDDFTLREPPLLFWSTEAPPEGMAPDLSTYNPLAFEQLPNGEWRARIPAIDAPEATIYFVISVTDNDDPHDTQCDHTVDTPVMRFTAVRGAGMGGDLAACQLCTRSIECASGICVAAAGGARCLDPCVGRCVRGVCGPQPTTEGASPEVCGDVQAVCSNRTMCTDDAREENDTVAQATPLDVAISGQICGADPDYFSIRGEPRDEVTVTVDGFRSAEGDLDFQFVDAMDRYLGGSGGSDDFESATFCLGADPRIYARVFGYDGAQNHYTIRVDREPLACCADDQANEPDNTRNAARRLSGTTFEGTICPNNDDYIAIPVPSASLLTVEVTFASAAGDLDIQLYPPGNGAPVGSSGSGDVERVQLATTGSGTYHLRIYGYMGASNVYRGTVTMEPVTTCTSTSACAIDSMCVGGACVSDACGGEFSSCEGAAFCPDDGSSPHCAGECTSSASCRMSESCKWFPEGRGCGVRGTGGNGAACASSRDCGHERACLTDFPNGYCARAGCNSSSDCEGGTFCVYVGSTRACLLECASDPMRCREGDGYECTTVLDTEGEFQLACLPPDEEL